MRIKVLCGILKVAVEPIYAGFVARRLSSCVKTPAFFRGAFRDNAIGFRVKKEKKN